MGNQRAFLKALEIPVWVRRNRPAVPSKLESNVEIEETVSSELVEIGTKPDVSKPSFNLEPEIAESVELDVLPDDPSVQQIQSLALVYVPAVQYPEAQVLKLLNNLQQALIHLGVKKIELFIWKEHRIFGDEAEYEHFSEISQVYDLTLALGYPLKPAQAERCIQGHSLDELLSNALSKRLLWRQIKKVLINE